jgi:hypothetical protein
MKTHYIFFVLIFLSLFLTRLYAQESIDSIMLATPPRDINFKLRAIDLNLNHHFELPEFEHDTVKRWEKYIFNDKRWNQFMLEEGLKPMADGRKYLIYSSPNDALHYFSGSDPILFMGDFHLKPLMGWEKFDLYFFYNGMLVNRYSGDNVWQLGIPSRNFIWEVGGGVEYEFRKNWCLFYEYSGLFRNQTFVGSMHKAGVRFRF